MDPETQIQQLKDSLRDVMALIAERNAPVSEDLKAMLVQVMEHVATRIQEIRGQAGPQVLTPIQQEIKELQPGPYPSSNINSFKYDYDNGRLLVKFQGKATADSGPVYSYDGVPKFIFDTFRKGGVAPITSGKNKYHEWIKGVTPSLGAAMYHLIRTNYPYQRVA